MIDRIREGKTEEEKKIADDFQKALGSSIDFNTIDAPAPNRPKLPFARARRNASQAKAKSAAASSGDAWKEGRAFPKRSSRIGFRYQVEGRKFPKAGTHEEPNSQGSEEL